MKRVYATVLFAVSLISLTAPIAAAQSKLEGVWKVVEVSAPKLPTITNPQPSLYIFTKKHYSRMEVAADKSRPDLPQNATDAQKVAVWGPFNAVSGMYEIKGNKIVLRPIVSKDPRLMAPGYSTDHEFALEGDTLYVTFGQARLKLVRIE